MSRLKLIALAALTLCAVIALGAGASARTGDRNHDRIPDRWEKRHHLSLHVNQARRDQDRDGLNNRDEFKAGTDPRDRDSDDDGVKDGADCRPAPVTAAASSHGSDDSGSDNSGPGSTSSGSSDDPATHDATDDHGTDDPATHDATDDHGSDDPATHDAGDAHGTDDPATHDAGDDNDDCDD